MSVIIKDDRGNPAPINLHRLNQQRPVTLSDNAYLDRQCKQESNARSYPRRIPIAIARAQGVFVEDTDGQLFIDCLAGAGTLALGHNHRDIHQALRQHLDSMAPLHTLDITTPVKDAFVQELFNALPPSFAQQARVQFCSPSGADAVEAAIKLAKTVTGRRTVLAFSGAYHGMTHATLAMMGDVAVKTPVHSLMPDVQFLPYPYQYRCPFGLTDEQSIDSNVHYIEHLLNDSHSGVLPPAAIIVEAIQGEGGVIAAPKKWLQALRSITRQHGILLILDEVQCGMGRSGKMFAFEHAGIDPDIIVISKAIGGGLPLAVIVYNQTLDTWAPGAHAGTFRGNQLAMVAGTVTLQTIARQNLCENAHNMGKRLKQHLLELQAQCPCIGDIRGRGLMLGVEIVSATQAPGPQKVFTQLASAIQRRCLLNGLIVEPGGRNSGTLRFLPPLIINEEEIDTVASIFKRSTFEAVQALKSLCATNAG